MLTQDPGIGKKKLAHCVLKLGVCSKVFCLAMCLSGLGRQGGCAVRGLSQ